MKWYLRACPVCGGDLHEDIEDRGYVACFMCGRAFAISEIQTQRGRDGDPQAPELMAEPVELPHAA